MLFVEKVVVETFRPLCVARSHGFINMLRWCSWRWVTTDEWWIDEWLPSTAIDEHQLTTTNSKIANVFMCWRQTKTTKWATQKVSFIHMICMGCCSVQQRNQYIQLHSHMRQVCVMAMPRKHTHTCNSHEKCNHQLDEFDLYCVLSHKMQSDNKWQQ